MEKNIFSAPEIRTDITTSRKIQILIICATVFLLMGTGAGSAASLSYHTYDDVEIYPLPDVNVTPIYDGTELVEIKGWLNLVYWKEFLFAEIRSMTEGTPLQDVTWTIFIPLASALLGLCFFVIFSRRNSPEDDPESTPAKILRYLEEHPGSRQTQIAAGIRKSRGAVAYQLFRLKNENKVATPEKDKTRYYLRQEDLTSLPTRLRTARENPCQREILELLAQHPYLTRHQIAAHLGKSPDTILWHLSNIDARILITKRKPHGYQYSLSSEAGHIYGQWENRTEKQENNAQK